MNILTESLVEETVQSVQEAGACLSDPAAVHSIRTKGETDYVTNVDLAVQELLRERLTALAPDVQFMGEEQDNTGLDWSRPCWILDPVDGTTDLIHNSRHSAVSLALSEAEQILFGVVYNPYTEECFTGRRELADTAFRQMRALYDTCQDVRRTGCASLDLCWVACGRLDGYVELSLQPWDYAAGRLLVEEAGGRVTAPDGSPLSLCVRAAPCWPPMGGSTARCKQF